MLGLVKDDSRDLAQLKNEALHLFLLKRPISN